MGAVDVAKLEAALVAESPDAILIADADGIIVSWNSGATATFGFSAAEAVGASLDLIVPERFRIRHWTGFATTMQSGVTSYGDRVLAVPATHRDGRALSIEFRVTLLRDDDGRLVAIGAVIRDVTERWLEDRQLRNRLADLEAAQHASNG